MKFNRWAVLEARGRMRLCRCDCGAERVILFGDLKSGKSKMCKNCSYAARKNVARPEVTKHGLSDTPTARSWVEMRRRCYATHRKEYPNYGGRGIVVCDRWRDSFVNFLTDMGLRPDGHTLDRIDNDGPYSPENCRWVPRAAQELNKRSSVRYDIFGERITLAEAARKYGIGSATLYNRVITLKWAPERAVTEHIHPNGPN